MLTSNESTTVNLVVRGLLAPLPVFAILYTLFNLCFYGSYFGYMTLLNAIYEYLPITIITTCFISGLLFILVCRFMNMENSQADEVKTDQLVVSFVISFCATFYFSAFWLMLRFFIL